MKIYNFDVNHICNGTIIGYKGEKLVTKINFDFLSWQQEFGDGAITLTLVRNGEIEPYLKTLTINGTIATWDISGYDLQIDGIGYGQLTYVVGEQIKKSNIFKYELMRSLEPGGDPPDQWETWLDTLIELGSETLINAAAAAGSASTAGEKADEASESATFAANKASDAEAWAVGQRGGTDVESSDPAYHNNSKFYADEAAHSVAQGGYIVTAIEDEHLVIKLVNYEDIQFVVNDERLVITYG